MHENFGERISWHKGLRSGAPAAARKKPVDIEFFVYWALGIERAGTACTYGLVSQIRRTPTGDLCGSDDCTEGPLNTLGVSADADACAAIVSKLPIETRSLVTAYGKSGLRPPWHPEPPKLLPKKEPGRRKPVVLREASGAGGARFIRKWCPLDLDPAPEWIAARRADYIVWWDGLEALLWHFRGHAEKLKNHVVTHLAAPRMPWESAAA